MKRKQFEEILDECISAYLEGRRSVEESLSLYPSVARELEPLLRAAADTAEALQEYSPPPAVQDRIRFSILRAANERAAARALTRQIEGFEPRRRRSWSWALALPAAAGVTVLAVFAGLAIADNLSDDAPATRSVVTVSERPEFDSSLDDARRQISLIRQKARRGQRVTPSDIQALVGVTRRLAASAEPSQLDAGTQDELGEVLEEQFVLLGQLNATSDGGNEEIEDALVVTVTAAAALGVPLSQPSPSELPIASPTVSPSATPGGVTPPVSVSPSPAPSASPTPTTSPSFSN
jgi:hypothetical protein